MRLGNTASNSVTQLAINGHISLLWTHILSVLVSVLINQLQNRRVCFNVEEPSLKRATIKGKNMLHLGSIFFPFRVAPMRIDFFLKGIKLRNCQN